MAHFPLEDFNISPEDRNRLKALHAFFAEHKHKHLGYPGNLRYEYRELFDFFDFTINNVGDPFAPEGIYKIHSHAFEKEVISFFAELFHAPQDEYWGYVTNGGTEGNYYALYLALTRYPDATVYYSKTAHYSLPKAKRLMRFKARPIDTDANDEMDYEAFNEALKTHNGPAIVVATIGTTMAGAIDDVYRISALLKSHNITDTYIHCDAALFGMILPFLSDAPLFDFQLPIDSISVSGHKMIGSPMPSGVVITLKKHVDLVSKDVEVTGSPDNTLSGSRNGHASLFLWYAIKRLGKDGFKAMVDHSFRVRAYALRQFEEKGIDAYAGEHSIIVVFPRPAEEIVRRWQLMVKGDFAHLIVMPNITEEHIDALIEDLST